MQDLGLSEAQQKEYIGIVKQSVKCEIDGDSAEEAKDYTKAIDSYSRCLMMEQSLLGMLHPSTWSVHKKIGSTFEKTGDVDSAIISHSKALAILESYLGLKEKETTESFNDLLKATLPKMRQADSTQNKKVSDSEVDADESTEKRQEKRKRDKTKKKDPDNDIYSVFASLRADASRERHSREDEKMEILMGLARKWKDMDEMETRSTMNNFKTERKLPTENASQNAILKKQNQPEQRSDVQIQRIIPKPLGQIEHDSPSKKAPETEPEQDLKPMESESKPEPYSSTKPETDFAKELERANDMANVLKKPQSRKFKLKPRILSFSKKESSGTKKKGIGKLVGRFSNRHKEDTTASGEVTQQKSVTNEASRETQQKSAPDIPPAKSPAKKYPTMDIPEIPTFNPNRSQNPNNERNYDVLTSDEKISLDTKIPQIPAFNPNRSSKQETKNDPAGVSTSTEIIPPSMDIPEIPAFNAKGNPKHDTENDPVASISSDSSMSSYESYESA